MSDSVEWEIEAAIWDKVSEYLDETYGTIVVEGRAIPMSQLMGHQEHEEIYEELFMKFVDKFQKDLDNVLDNLEIDTYA